MTDLRDALVVITGASSGIGRETARQLARRGARLALCARRRDRLEALKRELRGERGTGVLVQPCDVGDWAQVATFARRVQTELGSPDVLIANAGRGAYGAIEALDPQVAHEVVATNLLGAVYCLRAFLPAMLARRSGRLVLVSSALGELPAPRNALYGATKFALTGLAESLTYELEDRGVGVTLVQPGLVRTEFAAVSGTPSQRFRQIPSKSAETVAAAIVEALERGRRRLTPDRAAAWAIACRRHFPRLSRLVFAAFIRRMDRGDRTSCGDA